MLTVQDLIAKLQDSDPDAEVRISMLYGSKQECEVHPNIARVSVDERGHYGDHITVPIVYISAVRDLGMAPDEISTDAVRSTRPTGPRTGLLLLENWFTTRRVISPATRSTTQPRSSSCSLTAGPRTRS